MWVPFADKGRDENGCDCYGLLYLVYRNELGVLLPYLSDQYETCMGEVSQLVELQKMEWQQIPAGKQQPFDAVLMRSETNMDHVGIVIDGKLMLNTTKAVGVHVIEYRKSTPFFHPNLIGGFYRWSR
jgi:cell wall-associated NlpC family hydrolase